MDADVINALKEQVKDNATVYSTVESLVNELNDAVKANEDLAAKQTDLENELTLTKNKLNSANVSILRMNQEGTKKKSFEDMIGGIR